MMKKSTAKISVPMGKLPAKVQSSLVRRPLLWLGVVAVLPVLAMIAFTFKSGYTPTPKKSKIDKIVVAKTPMEIAEDATQLLMRRDTQSFYDLVDRTKDVNLVNSRGDSLLLVAVSVGNIDAVQRLLALGADINKRNSYTRDTPILRSLYTNHDDITRLLYYADADLNLENNYRISPMFLAVEKQKAEFVDLFLTNGAQAGVNSENLFRWVAKRNLLGIVAMLKGGVNPNVKNDKGNTPLIISASLGDVDAVQNLLAYRSDVNAANNDGNTALIYAARYNRPRIVYELMRSYSMVAPVDVDQQNKLGQTALFWGASRGYEEVVQRLLAANAKRELKTKAGQTALEAAQKNGRTNIVKLFEMRPQEVQNMVIAMDNARIEEKRRKEEAEAAKAAAEKAKNDAAQQAARQQAGYSGRRRRNTAKTQVVQPSAQVQAARPARQAAQTQTRRQAAQTAKLAQKSAPAKTRRGTRK